jgi:hypothetical protein
MTTALTVLLITACETPINVVPLEGVSPNFELHVQAAAAFWNTQVGHGLFRVQTIDQFVNAKNNQPQIIVTEEPGYGPKSKNAPGIILPVTWASGCLIRAYVNIYPSVADEHGMDHTKRVRIIAHELGHALGLKHKGPEDHRQWRLLVMAPVIPSDATSIGRITESEYEWLRRRYIPRGRHE